MSLKIVKQLTLLLMAANASQCDQVGFLPNQILTQDQQKDIDMHTFNHFYTFQVDRDVGKIQEGIELELPPITQPTAFTLKSWFDTAQHSHAAMSMRV
jgi:hypothetical protein